MNDFGFDLVNTPDLDNYNLSDGTYPMIITKVHRIVFENNSKIEIPSDNAPVENEKMEFCFQVAEGPCQNVKFNQIFSVYGEGTAVNIGRSMIKKIVSTCDLPLESVKFADLENKIIMVEIKSTTKDGKTYTNIKNVKPLEEITSQKTSQSAKPSWSNF